MTKKIIVKEQVRIEQGKAEEESQDLINPNKMISFLRCYNCGNFSEVLYNGLCEDCTKDKKTIMLIKIHRHGLNLIKMFNLDPSTDPIKLCKQLRRLENKAHLLTTKDCNEGLSIEESDILGDIEVKTDILLNNLNRKIKIFVNRDARGYALKIDSDDPILKEFPNFYKDWGGYGIISPDLKD